jgi:hypothetical protein
MLPTFSQHLGRYAVAMWFGLTLLCLMLAFALVRNSQALGLLELMLAGSAIAAGVTYGASRDAPGYWIYSTLSGKFMMDKAELAAVRSLQFGLLTRYLSPLQSPMGMPLLAVVGVAILLLVGYGLFPAQPRIVAFLVIGLLFPLLLSGLLLIGARYYLVMASPGGEAAVKQIMRQPAQVSGCRRADLLITLLITYALIWPLQSKPAFSLVNGYVHPEFIIAAVLLVWISAFFCLLGARRSRLYSVVGERLSGLYNTDTALNPVGSPRPLLQRMSSYYALLAVWSLGLCVLLGVLPWAAPFPLFCALLLPVLGWVFWYERGLTLQVDAEQAVQFIDEQAVQPVAVARRMPELN